MRESGCTAGGLLLLFLVLLTCTYTSFGSSFFTPENYVLEAVNRNAPVISPSTEPQPQPQPFLPLLAPSPLTPYTNETPPTLSGLCAFNFSTVGAIMNTTATDCWASFAPYLANVVCCPQFDATLAILLGQSSKDTGMLSLNTSNSEHCLSDVMRILVGKGANETLQSICSVNPANLTQASCPIVDVNEFESSVDTSRLLAACSNVNPVKECCGQVCQNAILDAARKISLNDLSTSISVPISSGHVNRLDDCRHIVLRWLSSKLDPSSAETVLRGLSSCNTNKVCPLDFPSISVVAEECQGVAGNHSACCKSMEDYVSHLQEQSFLTNLQALNCAASLGIKLQKANISRDLYELCHINLKDFSLQVVSQESGCLLPSLPSDAMFDSTSGISFICDLNDNIAAPWPSDSIVQLPSCNKTSKIPALPTATSTRCGVQFLSLIVPLIASLSLPLKMPP
ncbi:hypothetical protein MLD38_003049 [Melastoma candidum]|uniref:Uncharacterized protein n=1 Tax=Melastoma candidum TaxID=119954 RepID=A0ACB9S2W7_9MYRT|nr:hypothetical protein MLD38_003049 [Melastoma candidum]